VMIMAIGCYESGSKTKDSARKTVED